MTWNAMPHQHEGATHAGRAIQESPAQGRCRAHGTGDVLPVGPPLDVESLMREADADLHAEALTARWAAGFTVTTSVLATAGAALWVGPFGWAVMGAGMGALTGLNAVWILESRRGMSSDEPARRALTNASAVTAAVALALMGSAALLVWL